MKQQNLVEALQQTTTRRQTPPAAVRSRKAADKPKEAAPVAKKNTGGRVGKMQIAGFYDPENGKALRVIAAENSTTIQALLEEGLRMVFKKYGKEWKE